MTDAVAQLVQASKRLKLDEQIELFEALWDLIEDYPEAEELELTPELRSELRQRRERFQRHPESTLSLEEGLARLEVMRSQP